MKENTRLIINRVLSILSGVIAGAIVIGILERVSLSMHPMPEGLDPTDRVALSNYIAGLPLSAFLTILMTHAMGALAGGFVASKLAKIQKRSAAMFAGLILLVAGVLNLVSIPHPLWFSIADVIVYTPFALLGNEIRKLIFKKESEIV